MDYETFLIELYIPLKAIEILSSIIYEKANNDWEFLSSNTTREAFDELIALNFIIGLLAKHLLNFRNEQIDNLDY